MAGEEKTEKATPKKRRDAREKEGSVLQSNEVVTAVSVLGIFAAFSVLGSYMYMCLRNAMIDGINAVGQEFVNDISTYTDIAFNVLKVSVMTFFPLAAKNGVLKIKAFSENRKRPINHRPILQPDKTALKSDCHFISFYGDKRMSV